MTKTPHPIVDDQGFDIDANRTAVAIANVIILAVFIALLAVTAGHWLTFSLTIAFWIASAVRDVAGADLARLKERQRHANHEEF